MDWLSQIGDEAAQEAAEPVTPIEETPEEETDDWLADLGAVEEETPAPVEEAAALPVDEEADDIDIDWLDEIADQVTQEATTASSPIDLDDDDLDMDWLDEISEEAVQEAAEPAAPIEETPLPVADTPASPVDEEEDDFDMDWLESIGDEAAQEAAEPVAESPAEEQPADDDWLAQIEAEDEQDQSPAISDTDAWLLSMEEGSSFPEEDLQEPVADPDEWLTSIGIQSDEDEVPEAAPPVEEPELPAVSSAASVDGIQPTQAEEWKPEVEGKPSAAPVEDSTVEPPAESVSEPAPATTDPLADQLEAARQAIQDNDLESALKGISTIIKKGRFIEEVIESLTLPSPVTRLMPSSGRPSEMPISGRITSRKRWMPTPKLKTCSGDWTRNRYIKKDRSIGGPSFFH